MRKQLKVALTPRQMWGKTPAQILRPIQWQKLRKHYLEKANYKCEFCNTPKNKTTLYVDPEWEFNDVDLIADLYTLVVCCRDCFRARHIGMTHQVFGKAKFNEARLHLRNTNPEVLSKEEANLKIKFAFREYYERNKIKWTISWSLLKKDLS